MARVKQTKTTTPEPQEWRRFYGDGKSHDVPEKFPAPPPWRMFRDIEKMTDEQKQEIQDRWTEVQKLADLPENARGKTKGENFRICTKANEDGTEEPVEAWKEVIDGVNAALYLRRPLLVTGNPGTGKTSLAYAIASELKLGTVLTWSITARSSLEDGLYRYDAIARLQDAQLKKEKNIGDYIKLGSVGTAFLPSKLPRVLLIDEIDKSDINMPNDLLHLFEEGTFEISELVRQVEDINTSAKSETVKVRTQDPGIKASIYEGRVQCAEFPIVIMTSNGEREFPPAFLRRCLRVTMPNPDADALKTIVEAHFQDNFQSAATHIDELIKEFINKDKDNRATDQLLNTVHLLTKHVNRKTDKDALKALLWKSLSNTAEL
ncbi:ATPase [Calothrix sp. HK-06]|nr:ATPase [Calothrix sp. HK-06]